MYFIFGALPTLSGQAIWSFDHHYASKLPGVASGLDACAITLWVGTAAERQIWVRARESVLRLAREAVHAMQETGSSSDSSVILTVAGTVASIAAPFLGKGVGVAAGVLGLLNDLPHEDHQHVPLGADTPAQVLANVELALDRLSRQIANEEDALSAAFQGTYTLIQTQRSKFDIQSPGLLQDDDPRDFRTRDDLAIDFKHLRGIAHALQTLGRHAFGIAAANLARADQPRVWNRPYSIGSGATGPYYGWYELDRVLVEIAHGTALELDEVGHHLYIVGNNFGATDQQIQGLLAADTRRVDAAHR